VKKIIYKTFYSIFSILASFKLSQLTAFLIFLSLTRLKNIKEVKSSSKNKVIILEKSIGIEDLRVSFQNEAPKFIPFILHRKLLFIIHKIFYKKIILEKRNFSPNKKIIAPENILSDREYYSSNKKIKEIKKKHQEHLDEIIFFLKKLFNFKAVISFNYAYRVDTEFGTCCKKNGIKYIICQKESNYLEGEKNVLEKALKNKSDSLSHCYGDLVTVYSKRYKNLLVKNNVLESKKTFLTGVPRIDKLHKFKPNKNSNKKIVLIMLMQIKRRQAEKNRRAIKFWEELSSDMIDCVLDVAKDFPDQKFIFKTKISNETFSVGQRKKINKASLDNCNIVYGGSSLEYIENSKCLIGFNSTCLLEGIASKTTVLVPYFGIKNNNFKLKFTMNLNDGLLLAHNKQQFKNYLSKVINRKNLISSKISNKQKKLLKIYMFNSDGKSSNRMTSTLNNFINQ